MYGNCSQISNRGDYLILERKRIFLRNIINKNNRNKTKRQKRGCTLPTKVLFFIKKRPSYSKNINYMNTCKIITQFAANVNKNLHHYVQKTISNLILSDCLAKAMFAQVVVSGNEFCSILGLALNFSWNVMAYCFILVPAI
jgi:hypothetical protein